MLKLKQSTRFTVREKKMKIVALCGLLGYGYSEEALRLAFSEKVDFLGVDAGSTDPGPYYLGSGRSFTDRSAVKRDISLSLPLALRQKAPFVIGTAGGAGSVLAFYPEKLECLDNRYKIQGIPALGMIQEPFSPNGRYEAVMNPDMVTEIGGGRHETTSHWLADFVTKNHRTIYKQTKKKRVLHRRQRNASATAQPSGGGRAAESLKQGRNAAGCTADFD